MRRALAVLVSFAAAGCSGFPAEAPDSGDWVGTTAVEGGVTTVVNESGSVWGRPAELVEELSIGVDRGEEPYMFGRVTSIWVTDELIYVADGQVPAVRVYDLGGAHVRDIGRPGQGPGEYERPSAVATLPDGRVLVREYRAGTRTHVYSPEGALLDTWLGENLFGVSAPPVVTYEGEYFTHTLGGTPEERQEQRAGLARTGPEGIEGPRRLFPQLEEPVYPGLRAGNAGLAIPLWPQSSAAMLPSGAMVAGVADQYRIVADRPDGTRMIIQRPIERVPVSDEEWEWHRRRVILRGRSFVPSFNWDGEGMPREHPAFVAILADRSNRIWVLRPARVRQVQPCTEDPLDESVDAPLPCFFREDVADVYDEETGRLLGEVDLPFSLGQADLAVPFIRGGELYTAVEDEAGTVMVKRFRLLLAQGKQ